MWASLHPGQKVAAVIGVPVIHLMFRGFGWLLDWIVPWIWLRAILMLIAFCAIPFVYVRGVGMLIAVISGTALHYFRRRK